MMTMNIRDFKEFFPDLLLACEMIAADSGLPGSHFEMDSRWFEELRPLDQQCKMLKALPADSEDFTDGEEWLGGPATALTVFAVGEHSEHRALLEKHNLPRLGWFLNCFFGEVEYCQPGAEFQQ